jgi:Zn2+/Cd2+-exporting ATPase
MNESKVVYNVSGMDCADCALHVENSVKKVAGVADVKVNFLNGTLELVQPKDESIKDKVRRAVESAGYKMVSPDLKISHIKLNDTPPADYLKKKINELEKMTGVVKISHVAKANKLIIHHTLPVAELMTAAENNNLDVNYIGSAKEAFESNRWELIRIALCTSLLIPGLLLFHIGELDLIAKVSLFLAILIGGYPIGIKGWNELRSLRPGMNLLMSVAVIGAMLLGEWSEAAMVVFLFALAQYLEAWSMIRAKKSIGNLIDERPVTARLIKGELSKNVAVETIQKGDMIAVKPGERIPIDGRIISGDSFVDQSMITGESMPVRVAVQSNVYAGTYNKNGYLKIEAINTFPDSTFQKISELITDAQHQKAPQQQFVEKFATYYTPVVIIVAFLIAICPPLFADASWQEWIYRALVLLVIACPCAFVISTPVTIISALTNAIKKGILVKGGLYLENFSRINTIAFDKTGTLTKGTPEVQKIVPMSKCDPEEIVAVAASLEKQADHPLAQAIVAYADKRQIHVVDCENIQFLGGLGVSGILNGENILVGSHRLMEDRGICNGELHKELQSLEDENHTAVLVAKNNQMMGIIAITDKLREESVMVLKDLKKLGFKRIVLLTGDNPRTAETIGNLVGADDIHSELLPEDKLRIINELRANKNRVAMVGDGINDAPALAAADIGIAMAVRGSDTALAAADIGLMNDDLSKIPFLKKLSNKTIMIVKQNILVALLLKFLFFSLAVPGYATLWMAVFADMGASLIVIFNGLRALKIKQ